MNLKKIKKIVACAVAFTCIGTNVIASAAVTSGTNSSSTQDSVNGINKDDENVLKIDVDDSGDVTYTVPASASKYGDVSYDENRAFSWDNALVYFAITDRFYNGDTSNDKSYERNTNEKDASNYANRQGTFHGGDLKGMTQKIEEGYFDNLGINAIWFTACYEQIHGAMCADGYKHYPYHGYWALDFSNMDANMGTEADLEKFVDTAHEHGIRVVMDVVMNHVGYADAYTANEYGFGKLSSNWKDIYYNKSDAEYLWSNDYQGGKDSSANTPGMMEYDGDWSTGFWGSSWIRMMGDRFNGFDGDEKNRPDLTICSTGLPDLKTENTSDMPLPDILVTKWKKEGRYDKEMAELNDYFAKGHNKSIVQYLTKWLTDWVREFGLDGFRCDTAKHIEVNNWKTLKDEASKALKEWRQNNPNKPGAKWTDDFWMTGECYDYQKDWMSSDRGGYFANGFNSMINFSFQKNEGKSGSDLMQMHQEYANLVNNSNNNLLSYISSHDKDLGQRSKQAGTSLVLCPGGVQIFYGDETGRQGVGCQAQASRSQMNWDSINNDMLSHWQKVGQFRSNHLAVGAGKQTKINDTTCMRKYNDDVIVIAYPAGSSASVPVNGAFEDGQNVRDYYTGNEYTVSGGKVDVNGITNGVVLLELRGSIKPTISATPGTAGSKYTYYDASLQVTLSASGEGTKGQYSLNGAAKQSFTNGQKVTISQEVGESTTLTISGTDADGNALDEKTYTYYRDKEPEGITIYAKSSKFTGAPNAYVYDESVSPTKQLTGEWPGKAMTDNGDGTYVCKLPGVMNCQVIFNGAWGQDPAAKQPGFELTAGSWLYDNGTMKKIEDPVDLTSTISTSVPSPQKKDTAITISATANGGDGKYSYQFQVNGTTVQDYSSTSSYKWTPSAAGTYKLTVNVKDGSGQTSSSSVGSYTIEQDQTQLKINDFSTSASSKQYVGDTITLNASATGSGTVLYKFAVVSPSGSEETIRGYKSSSSCTWTPDVAGTYTLKVYAVDDDGNEADESLNVTIVDNIVLKLTSFKTNIASPQLVGKSITLGATATGNGTVKYRFQVYSGTTLKAQSNASTTSTYTWKPTVAGNYTLKVQATDNSGKIVSGTLRYVINSSLEIKSFTTSLASPQNANKAITLGATATGSGTLKYKFYLYYNSKLIGQTNPQTSNKMTWKPTKAGNYTLKVAVTDSTGKIATKSLNYVITTPPAIVVNKIATSVASPQKAGTAIKISVNATSGTNKALYYKLWAYNMTTSKWTLVKNFSTTNVATWTPSEGGNYLIWVDVKDAAGNMVHEMLEGYKITETVNRIEETNSKITYSSGWLKQSNSSYSGGSVKYTGNAGAKMTFKFTGTGIDILALKAANMGMATITVDGKSYTVDMYNETSLNKQKVLSVTGLSKTTTHTVTITSIGYGQINSTGNIIAIDAFDIYSGTIA